jgi:hypothetical protein
VVSEGRVNLGWRPTNWFSVYAGYDFLYLSRVVRAASLIDGVDSRLVPQLHPNNTTTGGADHPVFHWAESGFWAQGLDAGVELRF